MAASATLRLVREGFGIELRKGKFTVELDGAEVATLRHRHDSVELPVEPGSHTLRIRSGRYSSLRQSFDAAAGEIVMFRCYPAMVWLRYLASLLQPKLGIALRRE